MTLIVEHRTLLLKCIQCLCEIQQVYMPGFDLKNTVHLKHLALSDPSHSVHVKLVEGAGRLTQNIIIVSTEGLCAYTEEPADMEEGISTS